MRDDGSLGNLTPELIEYCKKKKYKYKEFLDVHTKEESEDEEIMKESEPESEPEEDEEIADEDDGESE